MIRGPVSENPRNDDGAHRVRQRQEDHVHGADASSGDRRSKTSRSVPRGEGGPRTGLAHVVDGRDANQLHMGMQQQPSDDLGRGVTTSAHDRCLEALHVARALAPLPSVGLRGTHLGHAQGHGRQNSQGAPSRDGTDARAPRAPRRTELVHRKRGRHDARRRAARTELAASQPSRCGGFRAHVSHPISSRRRPGQGTRASGPSPSSGTATPCFRPELSRAFVSDGRPRSRARRARHEGRTRGGHRGFRRRSPAVGALDRLPLRFAIVSDEELGSPEGQPVLSGSSRAHGVPGPRSRSPNDQVVTARKGTGRATVRAAGKEAHAGNAHDRGANAIWALARFIDRAQRLTDYRRGVTVNVGHRARGHQQEHGARPGRSATIDFRFVKTADGEATFETRSGAREGIAIPEPIRRRGHAREAPPRTHRSERRPVPRVRGPRARRGPRGRRSAALGRRAQTRALRLRMGIPSIDGLGPRGEGFHTTDERVEVASLVPKAEALARFLAASAHSPKAKLNARNLTVISRPDDLLFSPRW